MTPTHLFLQTGVGSFASGGIAYCLSEVQPAPRFVCVEPTDADCIYENFRVSGDGTLPCQGKTESISAGLNCGVPATTAWPLMRDFCSAFVALGDGWPVAAVRELGERGLVSGESGCAGFAAVLAARENQGLREGLGLDSESVVLLVNTEADTDASFYKKLVESQ